MIPESEFQRNTEIPANANANDDSVVVDDILISPNNRTRNRIRILLSKCTLITVEPLVFLMALATGMIQISIKTLYVQRICEYEFRNDTDLVQKYCTNLTEFPEEEQIVQKIAGTYSTYQNIIQGGPPILLAFIWGGLNDRLGSKNLCLIPIAGFMLESFIFYILTFETGTSPGLLLLGAIPNGISGGTVTLTISIFKLIVHYSSDEERTFRIGFAEAAMLIGAPTGLFAGAALVANYGFNSVFLISSILELIALVYAIIFLKNDPPPEESIRNTKILSLSSVKDGITICFKEGPNRVVIIGLIVILGIRSFVMTGKGTTEYLYTMLKFHWDQSTYTAFSTFDGTIAALGVLGVSTIFSKILGFNDPLLGTICAASFAMSCLVYGFASAGWMMYLGSTIQLSAGMGVIIVRSMISTLVGSEHVGKALSFIAIPEQILPFLANPFYNSIYVSTVSSFPGFVYLISAGLNSVVTLLFLFIYWKTHHGQTGNYENLDH